MPVALLALLATASSLFGYGIESIHVSNTFMNVTWYAADKQQFIGPHDVQTWRDGLDDPAVFNPTVSGVIEVSVTVNAGLFGKDERRLEANHGSACLRAHGVNPGVQSVRLWLRPDNADSQAQPIATLNTSAQCPAPQVAHAFTLDTTSFTDGMYELSVSAVDSRGVETVPDYNHAGQQAGSSEAYNGLTFPLHVTIAN